ncbi:MAG: hypothetical protein IMW89_14975 [Ktedonobacteraceae bacterium]|nr:hypothetical protein [Ktedonobacteraceae bacterium]
MSGSLENAYAHGRTSKANQMADTAKLYILMGQYMHDQYRGEKPAGNGGAGGRPLTGFKGCPLAFFPAPVLLDDLVSTAG